MKLRGRLAALEELASPGAIVIGTAVVDEEGHVVGFAGWHEGAGHQALAEWVMRPPNLARDFAYLVILALDDPAVAKHPPLIQAFVAHPAVIELFKDLPINGVLHLKP